MLYYSEPRKDTDTWTKKLAKRSDYRCKDCIKEDEKRNRKNSNEYRRHREDIEAYHHRRIKKFEEIWNDERVRNLPDPRRLMEAFRLYNIRSPGLGFTAEEIAEIIRANEIEFSVSKYVEQWDRDNSDRLTRFTREEIKPELIRVLLDFEGAIKSKNRELQVQSIRVLVSIANRIYENEKLFEKLVTTPGHRDPAGNIAPRIHLLTLQRTLELRKEKKERQINSIKDTIDKEAKVFGVVQERLKKEKEQEQQQQEGQGQGNNTGSTDSNEE